MQCPDTWACNDGQCMPEYDGQYASEGECLAECQPRTMWTCAPIATADVGFGYCEEDPAGEFSSLDECEISCSSFGGDQ